MQITLNYVPCPKCGQKYLKLPTLGYDECEKCRENPIDPPKDKRGYDDETAP